MRVERERELALRLLELRGFVLLVERFADERFAAGLLAVDDRLLLAAVFVRLVLAFFAVLRFAVERLADDLRWPLLRDELDEEPELALALPSIVHLPVITR